ncbi:MAG: class I SAM-dependent methyltransferase [Pseudomonadota bacterium]
MSADDHVLENRRYWDGMADDWVAAGERSWAAAEPSWGIWGLPEAELTLLPADMRGWRAVELGCGTGYVSAWMCRRGARVIGLDNSARQLATAIGLRARHAQSPHFIQANAEQLPLPSGAFDFAFSEYGAAIWCDPYRWLPEAHRVLRPGGLLTFFGNHPLAMLCMPPSGDAAQRMLHRRYEDLYRQDWTQVEIEPGGIEFNLPHGKWLALFRELGFEVLDYLELTAPPDGGTEKFGIPYEWARRWPAEHAWKLRKTDAG